MKISYNVDFCSSFTIEDTTSVISITDIVYDEPIDNIIKDSISLSPLRLFEITNTVNICDIASKAHIYVEFDYDKITEIYIRIAGYDQKYEFHNNHKEYEFSFDILNSDNIKILEVIITIFNISSPGYHYKEGYSVLIRKPIIETDEDVLKRIQNLKM